jgi:Tol biopolymer transport system component
VTRIGRRIPTTNPGIGHNGEAFLFLAQDEASVNGWMNQRNARYVMADYQVVMPMQKFYAIAGLARQCTEATGLTWSPDGRDIAFASSRDGNWEIYVMRADGSNLKRLTFDAAWDTCPTWSPDSKKIAFASNRGGKWDIYVMNADGTGVSRLTDDNTWALYPAWSSDGSKIAFVSDRTVDEEGIRGMDYNYTPTRNEIYVMDVSGGNVTRLTNNDYWDTCPTWSPDGKKIAYLSKRGSNWDLVTMDADGSGLRTVTSIQGLDIPAWSRDGTKLLVTSNRDGNSEIYIVDVGGGELANLSQSKGSDSSPSWSPDGKRIVFVSDRGGSSEIWVMDADGRNASSVTSPLQFYDVYYEQRQGKLVPVLIFFPEYYRSFVVRLYNFDGKEVKSQMCTVISYEERQGQGGIPYKEITSAKTFTSYEEAQAFVSSQRSGNYRIASPDPFASPVPLEPLNHYKLVYSSAETSAKPGGGTVSRVKVFEYAR